MCVAAKVAIDRNLILFRNLATKQLGVVLAGASIFFTAFSPHVLADPSVTTAVTTEKQNSSASETIKSSDGSDFMEEVPSPVKKPERPRVKLPTDFSSLGVPVDPNGHIVPLINKEVGPVMPFYSRTEQTFEPVFQNGYPQYGFPGFPYGYNPYGMPYGGFAPRFGNAFGYAMPYGNQSPLIGRAPVSFFLNRGAYPAPWFAPPLLAPPINNVYAPNPYAPVIYPWF